jgi:hypothetical protein
MIDRLVSMKPCVPDHKILKKFAEDKDRLKGLTQKLDRQYRLDPLVEKTIKQKKRSTSMMSKTIIGKEALKNFRARNNSEMERTIQKAVYQPPN